MRRKGSRLVYLIIAAVVGSAASLPVIPVTCALEDDNEKTGFNSNNVFVSSGEDSINVLNGNLTLQAPIYSVPVSRDLTLAVALSYNSKVWELSDHDGTLGQPIKVKPASRGEVGLGFRIRPGRIYFREWQD